MSYKLKHESISSFSTDIASKICNDFYMHKESMKGDALMNLTEAKQVNSFLIKGLFDQWQNEMAKLKSPYFNYDQPEVQKALKAFMNTLSNHISVKREYLEPLLIEAIKESILLTFEPREYLMDKLPLFDKAGYLKSQLKYIKTHNEAVKILSERLKDADPENEIRAKMDALAQKFEKPNPESFLKKINALDDLQAIFEIIPEVETKPEPVLNPVETTKPTPPAEAIMQQAPLPTKEKGKETVNDRFNGKSNGLTLAEKLQKKVNQSIEKSLTLNERIMFTNTLFSGKKELMTEALSAIDASDNMQEALNTANRYNKGWDMESEEIEAFMQVLQRRFN